MTTHARRPRTALAGTAALAALALTLSTIAPAAASVVADPLRYDADGASLVLTPIGSYDTGVFDESAAEIVAAYGDRLFVVDAQAGAVTVLDYSDPAAITRVGAITADGVANSVAIRADGLGVIALEAPVKTDPGSLVFFDANAAAPAVIGAVQVGALPDMVTITPDGRSAVVANEGEPADDFSTDPEGSVGIVALPSGIAAPAQSAVRIADFRAFEVGGTKTLPEGVRVFGPNPDGDLPVSRNLEPEYVAIDATTGTAHVTLQEANAIAEVDLATATVTEIRALGTVDRSIEGNGLDASDRDNRIDIRTYPGLVGLYQPDAIAAYSAGGATYLVTANEGDAREWGDYSEVSRVSALAPNGYGPVCADSPAAGFLGAAALGRLNVSIESGFDEARGCYSTLAAFGGRSFSIWTVDGEQVFDSGDDFEQITAAADPAFFNSNHTEATFDNRSDDKGPEPESVAIGAFGDRTYAFIGFERVGGIAVYDVTEPAAAQFVSYVNNRDFAVSPGASDDPAAELPEAGDLGPEGVTFIPAASSPTGAPLVAVANEVSGTTTLFSVTDPRVPVATAPPTVTGTPDVGATLAATPGEWTSPSGTPTYAYQWLRDGSPIPGGTKATYRVTPADQGTALSVRVTATAGGFSASADSAGVTLRFRSTAIALTSPLLPTSSQQVTVTVKVISRAPVPATGPVTVTIKGKTFTGTVVDGVARIPVGTLPRGVQRIDVAYAGDAIVAPSSGFGVAIIRR